MAKSYRQHFWEFLDYCHTLTNSQLEYVLELERERNRNNPDDECYQACYDAAKQETEARER